MRRAARASPRHVFLHLPQVPWRSWSPAAPASSAPTSSSTGSRKATSRSSTSTRSPTPATCENLASLRRRRAARVRAGRHRRPRAARPAAGRAPAARGRALRGREPRRPLASTAPSDFVQTNVDRHLHAARGRARATGAALPTATTRRRSASCTSRTDEVYGSLAPDDAGLHRDAPLRAEQPLLGQQGRERPPGARLAPHLRPAGAHHQLLATTTGPTSSPRS